MALLDMEYIPAHNHVLGIYYKKNKLDYALTFLKDGYENNETVLLLIDAASKEDIISKIKQDWMIDNNESLEGQNIFVISNKDWYFPDDTFVVKRVMNLWNEWTKNAINNGTKGLRVFADMSGFFKQSFSKMVFKYEFTLPQKFVIPLTAICAYSYEDLDNVPIEILDELAAHHSIVWDETKELNKKIQFACKNDDSHTGNLPK